MDADVMIASSVDRSLYTDIELHELTAGKDAVCCKNCGYWNMMRETSSRCSHWCSLYEFDKLPTGFCDRFFRR